MSEQDIVSIVEEIEAIQASDASTGKKHRRLRRVIERILDLRHAEQPAFPLQPQQA